MKQKIIVSNIRVPEVNWLQIRTRAAELGLSVNEYLNQVINIVTTRDLLGVKPQKGKNKIDKKRNEFSQKMAAIAKLPNHPMGANEDDKIIYDIK